DIQRASQAGGGYLNSSTTDGWQITFQSNGTMLVASCKKNGSNDIAAVTPTCGTPTTYNVPQNGAVYSPQSVIVSGVVNGRVTVASNNNVVVSGNISYAQSGDDVLGLVAENNVYVAQWAPTNLSWRAATIAETGS